MRRARPALVPFDATPSRAHVEPAAPASPDPVERHALGAALETALAQVRPEYRAAVTLRYEEGLSFDAIGQILGIPEVTARSHVHRARKELLQRLTEAGWHPSGSLQRTAARLRKPE